MLKKFLTLNLLLIFTTVHAQDSEVSNADLNQAMCVMNFLATQMSLSNATLAETNDWKEAEKIALSVYKKFLDQNSHIDPLPYILYADGVGIGIGAALKLFQAHDFKSKASQVYPNMLRTLFSVKNLSNVKVVKTVLAMPVMAEQRFFETSLTSNIRQDYYLKVLNDIQRIPEINEEASQFRNLFPKANEHGKLLEANKKVNLNGNALTDNLLKKDGHKIYLKAVDLARKLDQKANVESVRMKIYAELEGEPNGLIYKKLEGLRWNNKKTGIQDLLERSRKARVSSIKLAGFGSIPLILGVIYQLYVEEDWPSETLVEEDISNMDSSQVRAYLEVHKASVEDLIEADDIGCEKRRNG